MDIFEHNRKAWNRESREGSEWARPVDAEVIRRARGGDWDVILTPNRPVPKAWFGDLRGSEVLCLASGGGQQSPVLAAAGARVTSYDLSEEQLAKDAMVAEREGLDVRCIRGNMTDMAALGDDAFDLIFHPVSNVFVPDLAPVWAGCHRVLKAGGRLLAGFMNPSLFMFDDEAPTPEAALTVRFRLPYSEPHSLPPARQARMLSNGETLAFSHSLTAQIGGQLAAGLVLRDLYEDDWSDEATPLNRFSPTSIATLAEKPAA